MANAKTIKKRNAEMRKLCKGCKSNPESCIYFQYRESMHSCIWRQPK